MAINSLDITLSQFPEYKGTIQILYSGDDDFRSLCDDYCTSKLNAIKYREMTVKDPALETEYKMLAEDLEKEILQYILRLENSRLQ